MVTLPEAFIQQTRALLGEERTSRFLAAFDEEAPVSIRLNPLKPMTRDPQAETVAWCPEGCYLSARPNFTFDPLLHAGCYYVQEAASMFLWQVLHQHVPADADVMALDLCAAPGGKSTLLRAALSAGSVLCSNEPVRNRASVLLENVQKWGYGRHLVTSCYPKDYRRARLHFDVIVCDVPCSGEGMFRKDPLTIGEWSQQQVEKCWRLQRDIVSDAWACLNDGGLLVYSTCTFNTRENEENVQWMLQQFGDAEVLPVEVSESWNITGSLLEGFHQPVYRFIPGITRSEGLFMCVLRKGGKSRDRVLVSGKGGKKKDLTAQAAVTSKALAQWLLQPLPLHDAGAPRVELSYEQAIGYLRREALALPPEAPRGLVEVCFMGQPLGLVKNIGNRANNLYPKEWRIKSTHVPQGYHPVVSTINE